MNILLATDSWAPQVNGVYTTYKSLIPFLNQDGHQVFVVHPGLFRTIPTHYRNIRLALPSKRQIHKIISNFRPDAIHIGVEGPIGFQVKRYCDKHNLKYTTAFHTKFAEYGKKHFWIPEFISWRVLKWFHGKSAKIMSATDSLTSDLQNRGFKNIAFWGRGVDHTLFRPRKKQFIPKQSPLLMYVGRVSVEKNIKAFLDCKVPGTKCVVGDGPALNSLKQSYPDCVFMGELHGEKLAQAFSDADVFVFPSKTDTFGLVIIEALASGVPVAAYPVTGPKDILTDPKVGCVHEDLEIAIQQALQFGDKHACLNLAKKYSWDAATDQFLKNLIPIK